MQSFDEPWMEEDGEPAEHPYYNNIPNKMPPMGGFIDTRFKARLPNAADIAQVSETLTAYFFLLQCNGSKI